MRKTTFIIAAILVVVILPTHGQDEVKSATNCFPEGRYVLTVAIEGQNVSTVTGSLKWNSNGHTFQFISSDKKGVSVLFHVADLSDISKNLSGYEITGTTAGEGSDKSLLFTGRYFFPPEGPKDPTSPSQSLGACKVAGFTPGRTKAREVVSGRWTLTLVE